MSWQQAWKLQAPHPEEVAGLCSFAPCEDIFLTRKRRSPAAATAVLTHAGEEELKERGDPEMYVEGLTAEEEAESRRVTPTSSRLRRLVEQGEGQCTSPHCVLLAPNILHAFLQN